MSDQVFVLSLLTLEAMVVTPDCTLVSSVPSLACSPTLELNSVAFSAAVFENLKTESFATPAHLAALTLMLESDAVSASALDEASDGAAWFVLPKPQYFGLPLPRPDGYCCSLELLL